MASQDTSSSTIIFPIIKVVIAGDANVGKTSLIRRYCTEMFEETRSATGGVDFQIKIVDVDGKSVKLSIWDIAGQEQFGAFRDTFYRGAKTVALVYDLTQPATMENLPRWHAEVARICPAANFVIAGNKCDLERQSSREQAEEWAKSMNLPYIETSALAGTNVDELFVTLARLASPRKTK
jgi:Ras-related protein Rab-1A